VQVTPQRGSFTLDRQLGWFIADVHVPLAATRVKLNLDAADDAAFDRAIEQARLIVKR
jgi:hypothetical protein